MDDKYPAAADPHRYGENELRVMVMNVPLEEIIRIEGLNPKPKNDDNNA